MNKVKGYLNSVEFYRTWFGMVIVLFIIFGAIPLLRIMWLKVEVMREMNTKTTFLNTKADALEKAQAVLDKVQEESDYLNNELLKELNVQDYLVELVIVCSNAGFKVDKFIPQPLYSVANEQVIALGISGTGDPIELVENIENMEKLARVDYLTMTSSKGRTLIDIQISVLSGKDL